jgi:hypothetical protein
MRCFFGLRDSNYTFHPRRALVTPLRDMEAIRGEGQRLPVCAAVILRKLVSLFLITRSHKLGRLVFRSHIHSLHYPFLLLEGAGAPGCRAAVGARARVGGWHA